MVQLDYQDKEINEKVILIIIHNNLLYTNVISKIWVDNLIINFIPHKEQMRFIIRNELKLSKNPDELNDMMEKIANNVRSSFQLKNCEEEIYNIFANYDFQGMTDKVAHNKELFDKLSDEFNRHNNIRDNINLFNERKNLLINSNMRYDILVDDAAKIFKLCSKLIYVDNFYNYSINLFSKIVLSFYQDK